MKSKQTSIATVWYHLRTLASFSTPLVFHWSLPLNYVRSATPIGAGCIGAPIVLAEYKEDDCVRCASPIFKPIANLLSFTNRKRKYVGEKTTGSLKSKQTSITTVWYNILTVARLPTPLVFRYPLPLRWCSATAPMWTPPINESAELTRGAL